MEPGGKRLSTVVFSDLERHSAAWTAFPNEDAVALVDAYRQTAERLAGRFGARHRNFTGDGHLFLFDSADVAAQFALTLIEAWERAEGRGARDGPRLRLGCHFGECAPLEGGAEWVGRAIGIAKRVESAAAAGTLLVTESVLELIDLSVCTFEPAGRFALKGDYLAERSLYRITSVDRTALSARAAGEITAEAAFLRGLAAAGTTRAAFEEEAAWYREALRRRPDYPEAHNNLAVVLRHLGSGAEAAAHYREALRLRPDYPEANYNYALLLAAEDRLGGAAEHLGRAIAQRADYAEAHHALANVHKLRGEADAARRCYERTLQIRPGYAEAHNNFAVFLHQTGDPEAARSHFREALRLRPGYAEAHYNFALMLEAAGQPVAAQKHYEQAIAAWPDYPEAHNNLAALLHTQGCPEEAEPHYRRAIALRPTDPEAHYNYALLLRAMGEAARAEEYFAIARNLMPDAARPDTTIEVPR